MTTHTPASENTDIQQVPALVEQCRQAARPHAERSVEDRASLLLRLRTALLRRGPQLVRCLADECGKPEAEGWAHEVVPIADLAYYWSTEGPARLAAEEVPLDALTYPSKRAVVERLPRGVVGLITPWNFPIAIPLRAIFPALLAGNGVVFKPSEHAPRCGAMIVEAAAEVFGPALVTKVSGDGAVGAAVIGAGVDAVLFTGGVESGRAAAHAAAEALIPGAFELGGKDAAIVLDDAPVERTARGLVWGAFANAGQNCASVERIYATPGVIDGLTRRLTDLAGQLVLGRDMGPMVTAAQLARVEEHVRAAKEHGAEIVTGGHRPDKEGLWYAPTVVREPPVDSSLMQDETFGPVVSVVRVADEDAAVEAANRGRYGLTASVWTRDKARGERVARRLHAGVVTVNNHGFTGAVPSLPWSGVRQSGYGVTNSPHALEVLTRPRTVLTDFRRSKRELWWHPYTPAFIRMGRALATLRGGGGMLQRIRALGVLVTSALRRWRG